MSFQLSDLKAHNEELLKLLTLHLPDMLWVKDIEGKYLYANQAICDGLLMAKDCNEPIGKDDVFFALREREAHKENPKWHTFGELCFNSDQVVIDNNKAMRFEEYGNVKGELLYLEVFKAPFYDEAGTIIGTVGSGRDITKIKKIQLDLEESLKKLEDQREMLEYQANHDALTDLPNRVLFMDRLKQSIESAKRYNNFIAVVFIDLDNFKEINDSLGHNIGDAVLVEASKVMRQNMRKSDTLSRLGGDEFGVILNGINDIKEIAKIVEQGMNACKQPLQIDNTTLHISLSIGVSVYPNDGSSAQMLLKNADAAMYKAKQNGRNTYSFYDETMTKNAYERVFIENEIRQAFKDDNLVVYFQPQMNAQNNTLVGMEALVRWAHPTLGLIYPDRFIPICEANGMIVELDRIVMKKAIKHYAQWWNAGNCPAKLSMNLSMKQIEEADLVAYLKNLIMESQVPFENIEIEVTETQIMKDPDSSIKALKQISDLGISIAIDDFGTGYSSLTHLKRLPIHKLKIDKSFVNNLPSDMEDVAISKTIITLCHTLNLKVIAEGVESRDQVDFLLENGCIFFQGYHYSRPISADDMGAYIKQYEV